MNQLNFFVAIYSLLQLQNIVRNNKGKKTRAWQYFGEEKEHRFDTPALIITEQGAQGQDANHALRYKSTLNTILTFLQKNRKWLKEPEHYAYLAFDETESKLGPFAIKEKIKDLKQDNLKIIDFVSGTGYVYGHKIDDNAVIIL